MPSPLRIFVSSPGDVREERLRAQLIIAKLARDYAGLVEVKPYFWESEPLRASGHFQDDIDPPSHHDIVVLILWSRLGTPLPVRTTLREYRGIDGRAPVTGTEWEFEEALAAFQARHTPDLLVYRRDGDPGASLSDVDLRVEQERQWNALQSFWARHFENKGAFLAASARYDSLDAFDTRLEADLAKLIERRIRAEADAGGSVPLHLKGPPYRGLSTYDFADAPVFFGRDGAIRTGLLRLSEAATRGCACLMVLGASGSGKSSLARAGLLPALVAAKAVPGIGLWRRAAMRPGHAGADPVAALAAALLAGDRAHGEGLSELAGPGAGASELARHLRASAEDASYPFRTALGALAERERGARALLAHEEARLVLLVDQLEELFTRPDLAEADRLAFVRLLNGLARSGLVWVIATMRSDLWHRAAAVPELLALTEDGARLDLLPPDGAELLEMIRRPAGATGLRFEENEARLGLDAVLADAAAAEPGALPLLSVVLEDLYRRDVTEGGGRRLSFASYRAMGELRGAIAMRAETAWCALEARDPEAAAALPTVLRALVTTSTGETVTSCPSPLGDFDPGTPARRLINAFLAPEIRLLTAEGDLAETSLRLSHEALVEHWPRAKDQIIRDQRDLETRSRLESLRRRHDASATRADRRRALLTGLALEEGLDLARRWSIPDRGKLRNFIKDSQLHRRNKIAVFGASMAIVFVMFGWFVPDAYYAYATRRQIAAEGNRTDLSGKIVVVPAAALEKRDGSGRSIEKSPFTKILSENLKEVDTNFLDATLRSLSAVESAYHTENEPRLITTMRAPLYFSHQPASRKKIAIVVSCDRPHKKINNIASSNDAETMYDILQQTSFIGNVYKISNPNKTELNEFIAKITERISVIENPRIMPSSIELPSSGTSEFSLPQNSNAKIENSLLFLYISGTSLSLEGENYLMTRFDQENLSDILIHGKDELLSYEELSRIGANYSASAVVLDGFQSRLKLDIRQRNIIDDDVIADSLKEIPVAPRSIQAANTDRGKIDSNLAEKQGDELISPSQGLPAIDLSIEFDQNSDVLEGRALDTARSAAKALKNEDLKNFVFVVACFTANSGNAQYDQKLSERRAASFRRFLVNYYNLPPENILSLGYGSAHNKNPSDPSSSENNRIRLINTLQKSK